MTIRLLIADDHELIREGLRYALANQQAITIVAEAVNGNETLAWARQGGWDVLLLDLTMPDRDGFDVLQELSDDDAMPSGGILVYSNHDRPDFHLRAQQLGARGFLHKSCQRNEIIDAIQRVASGESLWEVADGKLPES